ncbi:MAG: N-6 DNA methylase [Eubacteriales bacterium]|nr:N-6 DNA methylase [Eubacteriales bacterium]
MAFWKKKRKRQTTAKKKTNVASMKPKLEYKPPTWQPTIPMPDKKLGDVSTKSPDEKIPETKPVEKHPDYRKEFLNAFQKLTYQHRTWDIWRDFIIMFACSLSNSMDKARYDEREKRYLLIIKKYNKQEQMLFPELAAHTVMALEDNPEQDFLGSIFMELKLGNESGGQFFTPYHVCQLMADITIGDVAAQIEKDGYVTIHDPCCGAGATLIAGVHSARKQLEKAGLNFQNHVLVAAQDIDEIVALMCYIQLSLLGVAAYIKVGNALTDPMTGNDSLDNYWFTMMYYSDVWTMRRIFHRMDDLTKGETNERET